MIAGLNKRGKEMTLIFLKQQLQLWWTHAGLMKKKGLKKMTTRGEVIETATNNLIMARKLNPPQAHLYMSAITKLSDAELQKQNIKSKILLLNYLRTSWSLN